MYQEVRFCAAVDCGRRFELVVKFAGGGGQRYCSKGCQDRQKWRRQKAREAEAERNGTTTVTVASDVAQALPLMRIEERSEERTLELAAIRERTIARSEEALTKLAALSEIKIDRVALRAAVSLIVIEEIERAQDVLQGREKWDGVQAKVFHGLLERALPTAPSERAVDNLKSSARRKLDDLSVDELEAMLAEEVPGRVVE
jgi:hypothetical protein